MREEKGNKLAKRYKEEIRKRTDREETEEGWKGESRRFLKNREKESKTIENGRGGEGDWFDKVKNGKKFKGRKNWQTLKA